MNDQSANPKKPVLIPLKVPWRISSVPFLHLAVPENRPITVEFLAVYPFKNPVDDTNSTQGKEQSQPATDYEYTLSGDRLITFTIKGVGWTRTSLNVTDGYALDGSAYDWTKVDPRYPPHEGVGDIAEWNKWENQRTEQWIASNVCPDPGVYEVQGSDWTRSIGRPELEDYRHYIFVGHDMYIEVLGNDWSWEASEEIDWGSE